MKILTNHLFTLKNQIHFEAFVKKYIYTCIEIMKNISHHFGRKKNIISMFIISLDLKYTIP